MRWAGGHAPGAPGPKLHQLGLAQVHKVGEQGPGQQVAVVDPACDVDGHQLVALACLPPEPSPVTTPRRFFIAARSCMSSGDCTSSSSGDCTSSSLPGPACPVHVAIAELEDELPLASLGRLPSQGKAFSRPC